MSDESTEKLIQKRIRELANEYRERGYTVKVEPKSADLPSALKGYTPDILARSRTDKVLIEVKSRNSLGDDQLQAMVRKMEHLQGWRLELVVTNPSPDSRKPGRSPAVEMVRHHLKEAERLLARSSLEAALLLGWSSFEGLVRKWAEKQYPSERTVPVSAVIKVLFSRGILSKSEFAVLDETRMLRDAIAHGVFSVRPKKIGLTRFFRLASKLTNELDTMG